MLKLCINLL